MFVVLFQKEGWMEHQQINKNPTTPQSVPSSLKLLEAPSGLGIRVVIGKT
jgi:hypothetical protein